MAKQHDVIMNFLKSGKSLTERQAATMFNVNALPARVKELREAGHCIYTNSYTGKDGVERTAYRLGRPSRKMVAMAYAAAGSAIFR